MNKRTLIAYMRGINLVVMAQSRFFSDAYVGGDVLLLCCDIYEPKGGKLVKTGVTFEDAIVIYNGFNHRACIRRFKQQARDMRPLRITTQYTLTNSGVTP